MKTLEVIHTGDSPQRLDRIVQQMTGLSRAGVRGLLDSHCIVVNGTSEQQPQMMVNPGETVRVRYDPHRRYRAKPKVEPDPAYDILHEDDDLIVVNKAAHVLTVPTASGKGKTLIDALDRHVNRARPPRMRRKLHVVHRLDQGVSGVLVIAKNAATAERLKSQFVAHKPQRVYIAIVNGAMKDDRGTFRSRLATDYSLNRYSTKRPGHGELAITHYEVIHRGRDFTSVSVQLETGRRNQIRVHFAEAGHPVLGDPRYPRVMKESRPSSNELTSAHPKWSARRIALHALSLTFEHPATRQTMAFEAAIPKEFKRFLP